MVLIATTLLALLLLLLVVMVAAMVAAVLVGSSDAIFDGICQALRTLCFAYMNINVVSTGRNAINTLLFWIIYIDIQIPSGIKCTKIDGSEQQTALKKG